MKQLGIEQQIDPFTSFRTDFSTPNRNANQCPTPSKTKRVQECDPTSNYSCSHGEEFTLKLRKSKKQEIMQNRRKNIVERFIEEQQQQLQADLRKLKLQRASIDEDIGKVEIDLAALDITSPGEKQTTSAPQI